MTWTLLACVGIAALVVLAYANSLGNGFVWDDHQQIVMNPAVKPDAPLAPIFTGDVRFVRHAQTVESSDYRPLQMLTYRLIEGSFGGDATAFHVCSLLFAMGCALAAFGVFLRLTKRVGLAFAAAALFAVYPVHTEAVDWIAALPELGCTLFLLVSFWAWLVVEQDADAQRSRWLWLAASWLAFGAALLWKETALVFPALLATFVLLQAAGLKRGMVRALQQTAPYWVVLGIYLAVRFAVLGALSSGPRDWELSGWQTLLNMVWLMAAYWAKLAVPMRLNAYYVFHPIRSLGDPRGLAAVGLLLLAAVGLAAVRWRVSALRSAIEDEHQTRPKHLVGFAVVWVIITLLPAMNLAALGRNAFTERYLFLPSVGFCLLLVQVAAWAVGFVPAQRRRVGASLLLGCALAACAAETILRNPDWKDDTTLFTRTLESSPDAPFVRTMVAGLESSDPAQRTSAEENYQRAIELAREQVPPDRLEAVTAYQGLASLYADQAKLPQALQTLQQADEMDPDNADIHGEEGLILARSGKGKDAVPLLQRALAKQPDDVNVIAALAVVERDDLHDVGGAEHLFEKAIALHTEDDEFAASQHNNLGAVFGDEHKLEQAVTQFREAVRIEPHDPEYHVNLAIALATEDRIAEARAEAEAAAQLAPNDPAPRQLLEELSQPRR